jgi:hypothetical protein
MAKNVDRYEAEAAYLELISEGAFLSGDSVNNDHFWAKVG